VSGIANLSADDISCDDLSCDTISVGNYSHVLVEASVANNVLTLTRSDGTTETFSKATSLDGAWSGGTLDVTASPQGVHFYVGIYDARSQDVTWDGLNGSIKIYANKNGNESRYDTGKTLHITAPNDWSYGSASSSSSSFSYDKNYTMNPNYAYHRFGVTVNGVTKYIQIHILQS
jgi:outer membrane protein assembly factor BamA